MLYAPDPKLFKIKDALEQVVRKVTTRVAGDYIRQQGQPWEFYVGYGLGTAALATGIPNATLALYVAANAVDAGVRLFFETSPGAAQVRILLDGVEQSTVDLNAAVGVLDLLINIPNDGISHQVTMASLGTADGVSDPTDWFSLLQIESTDAQIKEFITMPYDTIVFRLKDAETDTREASFPVNIPTGETLANIQTYVDAIAPEIDALTESQIMSVNVTLNLTLPGGLKATPATQAYNERGGLITFDTTGPRADSVRIPAMSRTIMPGNEFSLANAAVAALITRMTTQTTANNIRPRTTHDYEFSAARKGSKSLRK